MSDILETECSCDKCKKMCHHSPCMGTPQEMLKIAQAGFKSGLAHSLVYDQKDGGMKEVIAIKGVQWQAENGMPAMRCSMLTNEGLCKLHTLGLKPTEGSLMHHDMPHNASVAIRHEVLKTWKI